MKQFLSILFLSVALSTPRSEGKVLICESKSAYAYDRHECQGQTTVRRIALSDAKNGAIAAIVIDNLALQPGFNL